MRTLTVLGLLFPVGLLAVSTAAHADDGPAPATTPAAAVLAPAPPPAPQALPPTPPQAADAAPAVIPVPPTGVVIGVGEGVAYLGGSVVSGVPVTGLFGHTTGYLGYFTSTHLGVFVGIDLYYGSLLKGCNQDCSNAFGVKVPAYVEYAFSDRTRGAYLDLGFTFVNAFGASTGDDSPVPETLRLSDTLEGTFGAGYRFSGHADPETHKGSRASFDLHLGVALGSYSHLEAHTVNGSVEGDVTSEGAAAHYMFSLGGGYHWSL